MDGLREGLGLFTHRQLNKILRTSHHDTTPYRDLLVWLGDIRCPNSNLFADRATARIIALLAAYDRGPRLAVCWEEQGGAVR